MLKQLFSFAQIMGVLRTVYLVTFPDEYVEWVDVFTKLGLDLDASFFPGVCVGGVKTRLLLLALVLPLASISGWVVVKSCGVHICLAVVARVSRSKRPAGTVAPKWI